MSGIDEKATVAIVTPDAEFREGLREVLRADYRVLDSGGAGPESQSTVGAAPDLLLYELNTDARGVHSFLEFIEALRRNEGDTVAIVLSDDQRSQTALRVMGAGAYDYLLKPINPAVLRVILERATEKLRMERENRLLRQEVTRRKSVGDLLGSTDAMQDLFDSIRRLARSTATVAIRGESGSGKELVARSIHDLSQRRDRAFVSVNCAALPETLTESELFGYEKGAFTGATSVCPTDHRVGCVNQAGDVHGKYRAPDRKIVRRQRHVPE